MWSRFRRILRIARVVTEHLMDSWLFLRHNGFSPFETLDRRLMHKTIIEAHTIEKGLSLRTPKPFFGADKITALLEMDRRRNPEPADLPRGMLVGALRAYRNSFQWEEHPQPELARRITRFIEAHDGANSEGGVKPAPDQIGRIKPEAMEFLRKRSSVRVFGHEPLSDQELENVLSIAQQAPSQCNRQSVRVHVYRDRARIDGLLSLQGGARGFSESVPTLFVVTSEITAWGGPQQRNQPYVDGGIYTTMLLLSLDANGFVCCPLNLAITHATERKIQRLGNIPSRERLIVMVAAGPRPEGQIMVAASPRKAVAEILTKHS